MDRNHIYRAILAACDADTVERDNLLNPKRMALPPELALMEALIYSAITDGDLRWINYEAEGVFSFRSCCQAFGIDCEAARRALNAKIKGRPAKVKQSQVGRCRSGRRRHHVADIPGATYSHAYGDCPQSGPNLSRCAECRQRYQYWYQAHRRERREHRRQLMLRGYRPAAEASL